MDYKTVLEDMVTLVDGAMKNFTPEEWVGLSEEQKVQWCLEFGLKHAHEIRPEEL